MIYLNVAEPDAFTEAFARLRETLENDAQLDDTPLAVNILCAKLRRDKSIQKSLKSVIHHDSAAILNQIRAERIRRKNLRERSIRALQVQKQELHLQLNRFQHDIGMQQESFNTQIAEVQATATRRLQVLLFECLGEIQKAIYRAEERVTMQENSIDSLVSTCNINYSWAIFLKRCEEEFQLPTLADLPPMVLSANSTYLPNPAFDMWASVLQPYLAHKLNRALPDTKYLQVTRLISLPIHKVSGAGKPRLVLAKANDSIGLVNQMDMHFSAMYQLLSDYSGSKAIRRKSKCKTQLFPDGFTCITPLSSSTIRWLPNPSHGPLHIPLNGCVYYCIDEFKHNRARQRLDPQQSSSLQPLLRIASPNMQQNAAVASNDMLVEKYCTTNEKPAHLEKSFHVQQVLKADQVLQATLLGIPHSPLHFASANLAHLLQTTEYSQVLERIPHEHRLNLQIRYPQETFGSNYLSQLYVAVPLSQEHASPSQSPLMSSELRPISAEAIRQLVSNYIIRDIATPHMPSPLFALYRPEFGQEGTNYCIVENAQALNSQGSADSTSLLVQYSIQSMPEKSMHIKSSSEPHSILGTYCRWRSCLDSATGVTGGALSLLCPTHQTIEKFISPDQRQQYLGSDKLLEKAETMAPSLEIRHIKHSSSLLEELINKQLEATLHSFLAKVLYDGTNEALVSNDVPEGSPKPHEDIEPLDQERNRLENMLQLEKESTIEINTLVKMGVYPTAEIGLLKKSDDSNQSPEFQCHRKLKLFRTRRQEEEEKLKKQKKKSTLVHSKSCPVVTKIDTKQKYRPNRK